MALAGQPIVKFAMTRAALARLTVRTISNIGSEDAAEMEAGVVDYRHRR